MDPYFAAHNNMEPLPDSWFAHDNNPASALGDFGLSISLPTLVVGGALVWWFFLRKKHRKNPSRRRRNPTARHGYYVEYSTPNQFGLLTPHTAYVTAASVSRAKASVVRNHPNARALRATPAGPQSTR